jgi:hypothetical protein
LYDEIDIIDDGKYIHNMLFYPDGELTIICSGICLDSENIDNRIKNNTTDIFSEII